MRENKYDEEAFFQKYSQMTRSQQGLKGAGEWRDFQKLLPAMTGKRILDLGCGYGWHCLYGAEQGAASVVGTDISQRMLAVAQEKTSGHPVRYICSPMEELTFAEGGFDLVLSSLAFHYVQDFAPLVERIFRWLTPGGDFVFSVEHPVFTAYGTQDWVYDADGEILHFPVDRYFSEGQRTAIFLGEPVTKYHRTLTTYVKTLLDQGFVLQQLVEPQPPPEMLDWPGMVDELRRPMMLLVAAKKP